MRKPNPQNMLYLLMCGGGILAFVLLFIYPNSADIKAFDAETTQLQQKIQEQELLNPIYRELIKQVQQRVPSDLPVPKAGKAEKKTIGELNTIFVSLAQENQVRFDSAVPDPSSYLDETGHLTINVTFSGDFFNFRHLLLGICKLPYLKSIEELKLVTDNATKRLELKLQLNQA